MSTQSPARTIDTRRNHDAPTEVPAWMSIGEARAVLAAARLRTLPVMGHGRLIGLVTLEALGGHGEDPPDADDPVITVMDWHLVHLPPGTDKAGTLRAFEDAAWSWMLTRDHDSRPGR